MPMGEMVVSVKFDKWKTIIERGDLDQAQAKQTHLAAQVFAFFGELLQKGLKTEGVMKTELREDN